MLSCLTVLLICQLAGEVVALTTGLLVPGPVIGMTLLFAGLAVRGGLPETLERTADGLLANLAVLFVPAGVGVIVHLPLLEQQATALGTAVIASTLVTIVVTGLLMQALTPLRDHAETGDGGRP